MCREHGVGFLVLMSVPFGSCDFGDINCPAVVRPVVEVDLIDAETGIPVVDSARGVLRDGDRGRVHRQHPGADGSPLSNDKRILTDGRCDERYADHKQNAF